MLEKFSNALLDTIGAIIILTPLIMYMVLTFGMVIPFMLFQRYILKYEGVIVLEEYLHMIEMLILLFAIPRLNKWKWLNNCLIICAFYIYGIFVYKGFLNMTLWYNGIMVLLSYAILYNFKYTIIESL